jgi:hypothetical protein
MLWRESCIDPGAGRAACLDEPFRREQLVGQFNRTTGSIELRGKRTRGRQPHAGGQSAVQNALAKPGDQLPIHELAAPAV